MPLRPPPRLRAGCSDGPAIPSRTASRYARPVGIETDVVVVGAGVAGLACARTLAAGGLTTTVLERDATPGGRVRTDEVDGFLLDHGFQVLPRAYPEARRLLELDRLDLHDFARGAIVRSAGRFRRIADPRESPLRGLRTLAGGVISVKDGTAVLKLRRGRSDETTTLEALRRAGLSRRAVDLFFAPFLRGVFLLGDGGPDLGALRSQLSRWFGHAVDDWRHVRSYRIPHALPAYPAGASPERAPRLTDGLYACGDHREHPSLNGALASGRRAAEAVLADLEA